MQCSHLDLMYFNERSWSTLYKLDQEIVDYLWNLLNKANAENISHANNLAGNISKSLLIKDTENKLMDGVFNSIFDDQHKHLYDNIIKNKHPDFIDTKTNKPFFTGIWVNYQKKYEFNPIHSHGGVFSFVIWMDIPYDWEQEKELPFVKVSNTDYTVGNFAFVYCNNGDVNCNVIRMSPKMNGCMAVFPSYLQHMVYPFYTSDKERISIAGNIHFEV